MAFKYGGCEVLLCFFRGLSYFCTGVVNAEFLGIAFLKADVDIFAASVRPYGLLPVRFQIFEDFVFGHGVIKFVIFAIITVHLAGFSYFVNMGLNFYIKSSGLFRQSFYVLKHV